MNLETYNRVIDKLVTVINNAPLEAFSAASGVIEFSYKEITCFSVGGLKFRGVGINLAPSSRVENALRERYESLNSTLSDVAVEDFLNSNL